MKVKIINAMYRGLPTLTNSIGTEGIKVKDMKHLAISDNTTKMIKDCIQLLNDKALWTKLSTESRKLGKRYFNQSSGLSFQN